MNISIQELVDSTDEELAAIIDKHYLNYSEIGREVLYYFAEKKGPKSLSSLHFAMYNDLKVLAESSL